MRCVPAHMGGASSVSPVPGMMTGLMRKGRQCVHYVCSENQASSLQEQDATRGVPTVTAKPCQNQSGVQACCSRGNCTREASHDNRR